MWQPENALSDDIRHNLIGTARNTQARCSHVRADDVIRKLRSLAIPDSARRLEKVHAERRQLLHLGRAHELADGVFGPWNITTRQRRQCTVTRVFESRLFDVEARQACFDRTVLDCWLAVDHDFLRQLDRQLDVHTTATGANRSALVHQRCQRDLPTLPDFTQALRIGDAYVREVNLVKVRLARKLFNGFNLDAWRLHVNKEVTQAFVLRHTRVGSDNHTAEVRVVRTGRPDFLAVDNPLIAVFLCFGAQRR